MLVIYYCVTRPQYEREYAKDGKFSIDVLLGQLKFLEHWDRLSPMDKKAHAKTYARYARTFNYTFGIPHELVAKITGTYKGQDGLTKRISQEKVIEKLVSDGFMKVVNHGSRGKKDEDGDYKKTAWWTKKYLIANREHWIMLLKDKRYADYTTYPDMDEFKMRAVKIIAKFRKDFSIRKAHLPQKEPPVSHQSSILDGVSPAQLSLVNSIVRGLKNGTYEIMPAYEDLKRAGLSQKFCDRFGQLYRRWLHNQKSGEAVS